MKRHRQSTTRRRLAFTGPLLVGLLLLAFLPQGLLCCSVDMTVTQPSTMSASCCMQHCEMAAHGRRSNLAPVAVATPSPVLFHPVAQSSSVALFTQRASDSSFASCSDSFSRAADGSLYVLHSQLLI
ncbi:MAG: hypothetical protein WBX15_05205 [Thermoanaerobaculia bacterium]